MKIVGFGDSFIVCGDGKNKTYLDKAAERLDATVEYRGESGTGPWQAFINFHNYQHKKDVDVVVFAWSNKARLYHPKVKPICPTTADDPDLVEGYQQNKAAWKAAKQYYSYLYDDYKATFEIQGMCHLMDHMTLEYPNIKFIHMFCYADNRAPGFSMYEKNNVANLEYLYEFKNGVNIRPALMTLSYNDQWPSDFRKEKRACHMTDKMHTVLSESIYEAIVNYKPGNIINTKLP